MSIVQHLLENAIISIEKDMDFEDFAEQPHNKAMAEVSNIDLMHVWEMAMYTVYNLKPCWEDEWEKAQEESQ